MKQQIQLAAMMALAAMFTLTGYEFIRSAATVLFKTAYGAENLPLVMVAMPLVVFAGVALYGRMLSALGPSRTLWVTSLGSGCLIFCCYVLVLNGSKAVTPALFLLKEFYIVLLIEQYWSYINSRLTPQSAKVLNGPITGIAGIGGALGGYLVGHTASEWGTEAMLLPAALAVIPAALTSGLAYHIYGEPDKPSGLTHSQADNQDTRHHMGWYWLKTNPVLAYLLAIVLASQVVAAVVDFKFQGLLSTEFAGRPDAETAFQGQFWGTLNTSVLILQFLLVPLLLRFIRLPWIHILMPLIHLGAILVAVIMPSVLTVGIAFFLFKAFDYSLFRAAKEVLYIPLSYDERYRAKQIIDVFGYRTGKGVSSVAIVVLQRAGVAVGQFYLWIALAAIGVWLMLVFLLIKIRGQIS